MTNTTTTTTTIDFSLDAILERIDAGLPPIIEKYTYEPTGLTIVMYDRFFAEYYNKNGEWVDPYKGLTEEEKRYSKEVWGF